MFPFGKIITLASFLAIRPPMNWVERRRLRVLAERVLFEYARPVSATSHNL
jgi:hypothetical protein